MRRAPKKTAKKQAKGPAKKVARGAARMMAGGDSAVLDAPALPRHHPRKPDAPSTVVGKTAHAQGVTITVRDIEKPQIRRVELVKAAPLTPDAAALRLFSKYADQLGLTVAMKVKVLGGISPASFHIKVKQDDLRLGQDEGDRVAYFIRIFQEARRLFGDAVGWLQANHRAPLFGGHPPLERILEGRMDDLRNTHDHLNQVFGGWA